MKFGEREQFSVERLDEKGHGCGPALFPARQSLEPKIACGRRTIPGETVTGRFVGKDKGRLRLDCVEIASASPDRVPEACPHAALCGGCSLQHIRYDRQAALKRERLDRIFEKAGLAVRTDRIVPAVSTLYHRNRMDYVFGPGGELGLKEAGRWDRYVDLETCLMLSKEAVEVMHRVKGWAKSTAHPPWDNRTHAGYLRYLVIREGKFTGERLAMIVTAEGPLEREQELVRALAPFCTTVYHGINPLVTDLSVAKDLRLLHGLPRLHERISGMTYAIHPNAFFQTNSGMAEVLLEHVRGLVRAGPRGRLLDLYCGGGFFSIALSKDVDEALGIELDPSAIESAAANAEANGAGNVRFQTEAAETLSWNAERPDVVIVDPPRSGLHSKVRRTLLRQLPPRIIYVSCGPQALAEDLKELLTAYRPDSAVAFDLFPQTMHVETVIHLIKKP